MSSIQNLAPIMPFIEPIEPIELPSVFGSESLSVTQANSGQTNTAHKVDQLSKNNSDKHTRTPSEEEAILEKTRMQLDQKIGELNQLKTKLAETEKRERELASRTAT